MVALRFGLLIGLILTGMIRFAPQPLGSILLWSFFAVQLSIGAVRARQRMGLPLVATTLVLGAVGSLLLLGLSLFGYTLIALPLPWLIVCLLLALPGPILFFIESRRHPQEWAAWEESTRNSTVWDMLLLRHIPDLRG